MKGTFILVIGPSGSGKGTLLSHVREAFLDVPDLMFPVSCTTREKRPGEAEGETYHFVSREEFEARIEQNDFLEWAEYSGNLYGTLKTEIVDPLEAGKVVVREVEVQGARSILSLFERNKLRIVYIEAGTWNEFERRIRKRAPISEAELEKRRARYEDEVMFRDIADDVISNREGELQEAQNQFTAIVQEELDNARHRGR